MAQARNAEEEAARPAESGSNAVMVRIAVTGPDSRPTRSSAGTARALWEELCCDNAGTLSSRVAVGDAGDRRTSTCAGS